jgi:hypothetical protein
VTSNPASELTSPIVIKEARDGNVEKYQKRSENNATGKIRNF